MARLTLSEIASRIQTHLRRFEADPVINAPRRFVDGKWEVWTGSGKPPHDGVRPYYKVAAWVGGRFVRVTYITFQWPVSLTRDEAEEYLTQLDSGYVGRYKKILVRV